MKFGDILRRKREDKGMTQSELAAKINTTQQNVNSYETGYKISGAIGMANIPAVMANIPIYIGTQKLADLIVDITNGKIVQTGKNVLMT